MRAGRRAIIALQKTQRIAWLAQIAFGFAQARLSLREERLLGMTMTDEF
jgi:hypothetical protein